MKWEVGQTVDVQSRTWAGINKPGGCARITKIHYAVDGINVESIDVKYVLGGGFEKEIDPAIVSPFETLDRGGRKRRGRDFFMERADDVVKKVKQAIRKKASGAAAARTTTTQPSKTTDPDQSTSPSTPVTPEHPSMKVAKVPKVNLLAVPSYVIADRAIEVSPLPLDRAVVEQHGKETVVRRGLFGPRDNSTKAKQPEKEKQSKLDKPPEDLTFHETSRDISQAHAAAVKRSLSAKCGRNYASKLGTKRAAPVEDKPIDAKKAPTKTHLKDVFDYELRKAKEFLDEVCRAPCAREDEVDTSSKENRLNTSACNSLDEQKPAAVDSREEFLNAFQSLRRKFDEEDGMMNESDFMTIMTNRAEKAFTNAEIDSHLKYLCQEGRLMKSDGVLYIID